MTSVRSNNWGRWGPEDQRGMLNLVTQERILEALRLARRGVVYNLAVPLGRGERIYPSFHETWRVTYGQQGRESGGADDAVIMETHAGTHVDALSHSWHGDTLWNGRSAQAINPRDGVAWAGIEKVGFIMTRGVLADVATYRGVEHLTPKDAITGQELETCLRRQGTELREGNVLLVRTGWHRVFQRDRALWESGEPGPDEASADWMSAKGVVAVGADTGAVEWVPQHPYPHPFHSRALSELGILLIENVDLEALSRDRVYEFLFIGAPLPLVGASGASCVPLAVI